MLQWPPICSKLWHFCTCRYVGHVLSDVEKPGTGPIWLDDVRCGGCETHLDQCAHGDWGQHNCHHEHDVHIACYNGSTNTSHGGKPLSHFIHTTTFSLDILGPPTQSRKPREV